MVVQNTTNDARLSFDWIIPRMWKFTNLKIVPSRGELMPGESQVCKIIFKAENESRYYDFDAVCRIINESETAIYKEKKEAMEQVRRENRPLSGDSPTRERQKAALAAAAASTAEADAVQQRKQGGRNLYDIRGGKYKTLPPITPPPPRDSGDDGSVDALNESGEESSNPLKTSGDGRISSLSSKIALCSSKIDNSPFIFLLS